MSVPWTEKYRPKRVAEVIGNEEAVKQFLDWMKEWHSGRPSKKSAFLVGPPGVGKTSLVCAYANEHNYDLVEINASDRRGVEQVRAIIGEASQQSTLLGSRKRIILVDEVDGAHGSEAVGGISALSKIIDLTRVPIVMIANNPWDQRLAPLRDKSFLIKFSKVSKADIMSHLRRIATNERLEIDDSLIKQIAERSHGDLRSAINDLQMLSRGTSGALSELLYVMSERNRQKSVFDALGEAFGASTASAGRLITMNLDVDLETFLTWLYDNVPNQFKNPEAMSEAFKWLAEADLHLSRASREQRWGLMKYGIPLLGSGVGIVKKRTGEKGVKFEFPSKIRFMQSTKDRREGMREILKKISSKSNMSIRKAATEMLPYVKAMIKAGDKGLIEFFEFDNYDIKLLTEESRGEGSEDQLRKLQRNH